MRQYSKLFYSIALSLHYVNWKLWIAIISTMMLPSIYQTVRIFFLGSLSDDSAFSIASQSQYINLFYEVIQEALIVPLYFILGKSLGNKEEFANKVQTGLILTGIIYTILSLIIIIGAGPLIIFMKQQQDLIETTITYIRLETIANLFSTMWKFMLVVLISLGKEKIIYIVLIIQMVLSIIFDSFLISTLPFSLQLGVKGIAITNITINLIMVALAIILLKKEGIFNHINNKISLKEKIIWMKEWLSVGKYSGLESLLRNLAFMLMIVRLVNLVEEQGNYWVANNFIWNWLLLPSLALIDLIKKEVGENINNVASKTLGYIALTTILSILWIASIPLWKPFLQHIMNISDYELVFYIILIQTPFYIIFMYNNVLDGTFAGAGRLDYLFIQTIFINVIYYGILFILYLLGIFSPNITGICLMFGFGIALDFIPTFIQYRRFLRKNNLKILYKNNKNI